MIPVASLLFGAPGTIRTCDFQIRSLTLYPLNYGRVLKKWRRERDSNPRYTFEGRTIA